MPYNKKRQIDAGSDGELQTAKKVKSESKKAGKDLSKGTDAEGNAYWEVGFPRFALPCFESLILFVRLAISGALAPLSSRAPLWSISESSIRRPMAI